MKDKCDEKNRKPLRLGKESTSQFSQVLYQVITLPFHQIRQIPQVNYKIRLAYTEEDLTIIQVIVQHLLCHLTSWVHVSAGATLRIAIVYICVVTYRCFAQSFLYRAFLHDIPAQIAHPVYYHVAWIECRHLMGSAA